jgi:tellurite resistance protein
VVLLEETKTINMYIHHSAEDAQLIIETAIMASEADGGSRFVFYLNKGLHV